jgi:hypothetical protein
MADVAIGGQCRIVVKVLHDPPKGEPMTMTSNPTCEHADQEQIGPCVYCSDCGLRLYHGQLPKDQRPECSQHDWDTDSGLGFYFQCRTCGDLEWPE